MDEPPTVNIALAEILATVAGVIVDVTFGSDIVAGGVIVGVSVANAVGVSVSVGGRVSVGVSVNVGGRVIVAVREGAGVRVDVRVALGDGVIGIFKVIESLAVAVRPFESRYFI